MWQWPFPHSTFYKKEIPRNYIWTPFVLTAVYARESLLQCQHNYALSRSFLIWLDNDKWEGILKAFSLKKVSPQNWMEKEGVCQCERGKDWRKEITLAVRRREREREKGFQLAPINKNAHPPSRPHTHTHTMWIARVECRLRVKKIFYSSHVSTFPLPSVHTLWRNLGFSSVCV